MTPAKLCCPLLLLVFVTLGFQSEQEEIRELNQPLLQAAAEGSINQVKSLVSKGASVNAKG